MDLENIGIALLALACGWLGSLAQSYFSEKGKNLATKEDIQEITAKVEFVKSQFSNKHLRSKAYIERQITAYDEICHLLNAIKLANYKADGKIQTIQEHNTTYSKDKYKAAIGLMNKLDEHLIFISPLSCMLITDTFEKACALAETEYKASLLDDTEERRGAVIMAWHPVLDAIDEVLLQIRRELCDE